jgi:hypothetical protein
MKAVPGKRPSSAPQQRAGRRSPEVPSILDGVTTAEDASKAVPSAVSFLLEGISSTTLQSFLADLSNLGKMNSEQKLFLLLSMAEEVRTLEGVEHVLSSRAVVTGAAKCMRFTTEDSSKAAPEKAASPLFVGASPNTLHSFEKGLRNIGKMDTEQKLALLSSIAGEVRTLEGSRFVPSSSIVATGAVQSGLVVAEESSKAVPAAVSSLLDGISSSTIYSFVKGLRSLGMMNKEHKIVLLSSMVEEARRLDGAGSAISSASTLGVAKDAADHNMSHIPIKSTI